MAEVENALYAEQGGICAYTGQRIAIKTTGASTETTRRVEFHIEHLRPQKHCTEGQDAEYANLVACWPKPNWDSEPPYGAPRKGDWPSPDKENCFVSPHRSDCSARFKFNQRGQVTACPGDQAAAETIKRLGLDHKALTALRREAIGGFLNPPGGQIRLTQAQRLLRELDKDSQAVDEGDDIQLAAFCFAVRQAVDHEISKLKAIVAGK